ncbi:hypothetical protein A5788_04590 [Gordonia sp. 852002-50816_SCH5313054-c]|nr:hypothetical protein A5786_10795 [Gordonia sp. 852002-50816_SCH5313054-a]OBC21140.1 hypothetical protein A5788_04590 [Gordonia sp. 852002-50816_SCH5313054-c]
MTALDPDQLAPVVRDLPAGHDAPEPAPDWGLVSMPRTYVHSLAPWRVAGFLTMLYRTVVPSASDLAAGRVAALIVVRDLYAPTWLVENYDALGVRRSALSQMVEPKTGLLLRGWGTDLVPPGTASTAVREKFLTDTEPGSAAWAAHDGDKLTDHYAALTCAQGVYDRRHNHNRRIGRSCDLCGLAPVGVSASWAARERHPLEGLPGISDIAVKVCGLCAETIRAAAVERLAARRDNDAIAARVGELLDAADLPLPAADEVRRLDETGPARLGEIGVVA